MGLWKGISQVNVHTTQSRAPSKSKSSFQLTFKQEIIGKSPRNNVLNHRAYTVIARE